MILREFASNAYVSANTYLEYLKQSNKGKEIIHVTKIRTLEDKFVLSLEKKTPFADSLVMKINSPLFPESLKGIVKIICFNEMPPSVIIKVSSEYTEKFKSLEPFDITFESSFLFLVEAVRDWYREYWRKIEDPTLNEYDVLKFQPSNDDKITESQINAINTALSSEISYIWGAPGTGKTRYVLSNCIMEYVKRKKKVLLMAPTNNALEQSLRGVIQVFKENEIETSNIVRLGNPTQSFAVEHPEVCLSTVSEHKLKSLKEELKELNDKNAVQLEYQQIKRKFEKFVQLKQEYNEIEINIGKLSAEKNQLRQEIKTDEADLKVEQKNQKQFENELSEIIQEKNSFLGKVKSFFSKATREDFDKRIEEAKAKRNKSNETISLLILKIQEKKETLTKLEKEYSEYNSKYLNLRREALSAAPKICFNFGEAEKAFADYFTKNQDLIIDEAIPELIEKKQEEINFYEKQQKIELGQRYVVACTVDYAFLHYGEFPQEMDLDACHLFVDEAAYCPMIKAGVFFSYGVPVTFLGDHMQLPPICEMSEKNVRENQNFMFLWSQASIYFPEILLYDNEMLDLRIRFLQRASINKDNVCVAELEETHRFGNNLATILDNFVYKFGFKGIASEETKITVINVPRNYAEDKFVNLQEAYAIKKYIKSNNLQSQEVAVLTPYRKQVSALKKVLGNVLDVSTIHASQGREWDTVIISVVEKHDKFFMDSTNTESDGLKIINTAISRAKKEVVLVLDYDHWKTCYKQQLIGNIAINHTSYLEADLL